MSQGEAWNVGRLLSWTADFLGKRGASSPRLDAEVLLARSLKCERIELYTRFTEEPSDEERSQFRELVRRRAEGMPVAYLVGHREFFSLPFRVTTDVLIPRPETEHLVVAAIDLARQVDGGAAVCDVGTGSGIIAVCLARQTADCRVTGLDISPAALEVARQNAAAHGVTDRVEFLQSDLFGALPPDRTFDLILSNPPYVSQTEYERLAPEVNRYEPREALLAGPTGTEVIARLLPEAARRLNPAGRLLVEISPMIHEAVCRLVEEEPLLTRVRTIKDLAGHHRVIVAARR